MSSHQNDSRAVFEALRVAIRVVAILLLALATVKGYRQLMFMAGAVHTDGRVVGFGRVSYREIDDHWDGRTVRTKEIDVPIVAFGPGEALRWQAESPFVPNEIGRKVRLVYHPGWKTAPRLDGPAGFETSFLLALIAIPLWLVSRPERRKRSAHGHHA